MPSEFAIRKTKEYCEEEDPAKKKKIIREMYDDICEQERIAMDQLKTLSPDITDKEIFDMFWGLADKNIEKIFEAVDERKSVDSDTSKGKLETSTKEKS